MFPNVATVIAAISALQSFTSIVSAYELSCSSAGINHVNFPDGLTCTGETKYTDFPKTYTDPKTWGDELGKMLVVGQSSYIDPMTLPMSCRVDTKSIVFKDGSTGDIITGCGAWDEDHVPGALQLHDDGIHGSGNHLPWRNGTRAVSNYYLWGSNAIITLYGWSDGLGNSLLCSVNVSGTGAFQDTPLPQCTCTQPTS